MTRRNFLSRAVGCLAVCVLAPVRAITAEIERERIVRLIRERNVRLRREMAGFEADFWRRANDPKSPLWGIRYWLVPPSH